MNAEILEEELKLAITKLGCWKSAGSDGTPLEVYKTALPGTPFFGYLPCLLGKEWGSGKVDPLWNIAEVVPVPKKGDTQLVDNHRVISLVPVGLKHINGMVARRLSSSLEEGNFFAREQTGFSRLKCRKRRKA
ncbi:MAG: uncharacterized protein A8A55_3156 [Amphiamblys sp. WSBS2006]|nr:MAG: uncharacterized protein A8A55_3156 [Amphiamblys sp. WSBS2006]